MIIRLICNKHNVKSHYQLYLEYFIELLKLKNKNISVCEIGGADGWAISCNSKNIMKKTMIDSDNMYERSLRKAGMNFIHARLGANELKLRSQFDLVILNHVIEHILDYNSAINELYQMIKPGGFVVIRCPNILVNEFLFWNDFTHVKPYTIQSLDSAFRSHGFKTIASRKFSYNFFTLGYLFNKKIQNWLSSVNGDEILYIGQKTGS